MLIYILFFFPLTLSASTLKVNQQLKLCDRFLSNNDLTTGKDGNALSCYKTILVKHPDNHKAKNAISIIEQRFIHWADKAILRHSRSKLLEYIEKLKLINPKNLYIIKYTKIYQSLKDKPLKGLQLCDSYLLTNDLTAGKNGDALSCYRHYLSLNPSSNHAKKGLVEIEQRFLKWSEKAINNRDIDKLNEYIHKLEKINPNLTEIEFLSESRELLIAMSSFINESDNNKTSSIQAEYNDKLKLVVNKFSLEESIVSSDEPSLPDGLEEVDEPNLPSGLAMDEPSLPTGLISSDIPDLPSGLDLLDEEKNEDIDTEDSIDEKTYDFYGFWDNRLGYRIKNNQYHGARTVAESRLHLAFDKDFNTYFDTVELQSSIDILYDDLADTHKIDLESGNGWLDIRQLNLFFKPLESVDIRLGRQILTWGTGDFLFLNDLFPKDWSYFLGRDMEYVKAPSDALKVSFFSDIANIDVVYVPRFDSDRYISGERLSFYHDIEKDVVGLDNIIDVDKPDDWFSNDEFHLRLSQNFDRNEVALYAYDGYFKSPAGYEPNNDQFTFPRLGVYGLSLRRPLGVGIFNTEIAYWHSKDDDNGDNPLIKNSQTRFTLGYKWELASELTMGLQYYSEYLHDYDNYRDNNPYGSYQLPKVYDLFSLRITQFLLNQNLKLGFFSFYRYENNDFYIRPEINYKINDAWEAEVGASLFGNGDGDSRARHGQLKDNSNIYFMMRYNFSDF